MVNFVAKKVKIGSTTSSLLISTGVSVVVVVVCQLIQSVFAARRLKSL